MNTLDPRYQPFDDQPQSKDALKAERRSVPTRQRPRAAAVAVAVAIGLTALKLSSGWVIGSMAMIASGVDSLMDALSSLVNLLALRHAERPPDRHHSYGHGKAEDLAALFQAMVISASAVVLCFASVDKLRHPRPLDHQGWGILVMLLALGVTFGLIRYLRAAAARTNSLALNADAVHYQTDLYTGLAVAMALALNWFTGIVVLDALFSLGIAGPIVVLAVRIGRQAVNQLMDRELSSNARHAIIALIESHYPNVHGFHDLRTRTAGPSVFIEVHLEIDRRVSFDEAHGITEHIIADIERLIPHARVNIHADPVHKPALLAGRQ